MIDDNTIDLIKQSFYTGPDHDTLIISDNDSEAFWNWFAKNSSQHTNVQSGKEFKLEGNLSGRCFGNSQTIALNHGVNYYEGFVKMDGRFLFHGFNYTQTGIVDITALSFPENFKDFNGNLPSCYIGLHIPTELIKANNSEAIKPAAVNVRYLIDHLYKKH